MKRYTFIVIFILLFTYIAKAGEGDTYLSLSGGFLHKKALSFEVSLEKTLKYHHAFEVGFDYYNQFFFDNRIVRVDLEKVDISNLINFNSADSTAYTEKKYQALLLNGAYKLNLIRYKNANFRFVGGVGVGVNDDEKFTLSVSPGFEYTYTISGNVQFFFKQKNQFSFWTNNNSWFRTGLMIGIKIPLR